MKKKVTIRTDIPARTPHENDVMVSSLEDLAVVSRNMLRGKKEQMAFQIVAPWRDTDKVVTLITEIDGTDDKPISKKDKGKYSI